MKAREKQCPGGGDALHAQRCGAEELGPPGAAGGVSMPCLRLVLSCCPVLLSGQIGLIFNSAAPG